VYIKGFLLKYVNNNLLITIVGTINELPNLEHLCVRLNCLHVKYGICLSVNKKNNSVVTGGSLKYIYGLKQIENIEHDIKTYVSSFSFLQINDDIKEQIYNQISSLITGKVVLDAYSGRGVLSAIMSKKAKKVISIEISQDAVNDAIYMFATNGISNVDCLCGDFEVLVDEILEKVDTVVLDPPRKGIYQGALSKILELSPTKIIYLSCASNTLARDLKVLLQDNLYKVTLVQPYDMFPNCNDVETLVVLEKCNDKR
jgi:23S rRNA (uracil1939-C5)-methyltransferase